MTGVTSFIQVSPSLPVPKVYAWPDTVLRVASGSDCYWATVSQQMLPDINHYLRSS